MMSAGRDRYLQELFTQPLPSFSKSGLLFWTIDNRERLAAFLGVVRASVLTILVGLSDDPEEDQKYLAEINEIVGNSRKAIRIIAMTSSISPEIPEDSLPVDLVVDHGGGLDQKTFKSYS